MIDLHLSLNDICALNKQLLLEFYATFNNFYTVIMLIIYVIFVASFAIAEYKLKSANDEEKDKYSRLRISSQIMLIFTSKEAFIGTFGEIASGLTVLAMAFCLLCQAIKK